MPPLDDYCVTVDCPRCGFAMDIQLRAIRLQETVFCSACKASIRLVDQDASTHRAAEELDSALNDLKREFKKLNTTITIKC